MEMPLMLRATVGFCDFLPSTGRDTPPLVSPLPETHSTHLSLAQARLSWLACPCLHYLPCYTCGKVVQTPTLKASPSSGWAGILVHVCLITTLDAAGPGRAASGLVWALTSRTVSAWSTNSLRHWIILSLAVNRITGFHHLTA